MANMRIPGASKLLLSLAVIIFATLGNTPMVHAGETGGAWAPWSPIVQVLVRDGGIEIIQAEVTSPPTNFDTEIERSFFLPKTDANYEAMAATITSAYLAGHLVSVYYTGSTNSWTTPLEMLKAKPS